MPWLIHLDFTRAAQKSEEHISEYRGAYSIFSVFILHVVKFYLMELCWPIKKQKADILFFYVYRTVSLTDLLWIKTVRQFCHNGKAQEMTNVKCTSKIKTGEDWQGFNRGCCTAATELGFSYNKVLIRTTSLYFILWPLGLVMNTGLKILHQASFPCIQCILVNVIFLCLIIQ